MEGTSTNFILHLEENKISQKKMKHTSAVKLKG